MDGVLTALRQIERHLQLEIAHLPQTQMLTDIRRLIRMRQAMHHPWSDRLLCDIVHEAQAVAAWENEGGAVR